MKDDTRYDPDLIDKDNRNVIDAYKGWKIEAIKQELAERAFPLHIAIENFQHDYNIGTIVRNANAFNVSGVHIIGKRHWNRRGAMATEKYLNVHNHSSIEEFAKWAKHAVDHIIGIDNTEGSIALQKAKLPANAVYIFGQEGPGLSDEAQSICEHIVAIEQYGSTRSVNVGVASGIVLHEWTKRYLN